MKIVRSPSVFGIIFCLMCKVLIPMVKFVEILAFFVKRIIHMTLSCVRSDDVGVRVRGRSTVQSFRRMSVPVLVGTRQERDLPGDAGRLRAAHGDDGLEHVPAHLRRRRAQPAGPTDDRSPADTPAARHDEGLAYVQDHARGSCVD